jgi:exopolyphosphatase/guanosine-5'-triphosphate,3'-diphosphate pyrophosphatase
VVLPGDPAGPRLAAPPSEAPARLACIDIGSNTTRLLVADRAGRRLTWVHQERAFTRIGSELGQAGQLGSAKIAEVVAVVRSQLASAHQLGAARVCTVATAAIRTANNRGALTEAIAVATGLQVEILSDEQEARLAFIGVAGTLERPAGGTLGVVDVGGGSSELAVGTAPDQVRWWASLPVGSGNLAGGDDSAPTPSAAVLSATRERLVAELARLHIPQPELAVAAGGSATSLGLLVGPVLDPARLRWARDLLARTPVADIARRFAIDPQRVRLLPGGLLILEAVAERFAVPLQVGRGGIREGVLLEA